MTPPWPPGSATGAGGLAGTDARDALKLVLDELPSFPFLPELASRGVGADAVGRTVATLVDLHAEVVTGGWRLAARPAPEERQARELLERDLEALESAAPSYQGSFKVALVGPWTLAARLELPKGERAVSDPAAVTDLAGSLAEGVAAVAAEVRARLPGVAHVVVELDETLLGAAMAGDLPTASGWGRYPAVEEQVASDVVASVVGAVDDAGVRLDGPGPLADLVRRAGARFLALDATALGPGGEDDLGETLEAGTGLLAGLVPAGDDGRAADDDLARPARRLWGRLGLDPALLPHQVVVTPSGGLGAVAPEQAAAVLRRCTRLAGLLREEPEEAGGPARA